MKTLVKTIFILLTLLTMIFTTSWRVKAQESFLIVNVYPVMAKLNSEVQNEIVLSVEVSHNSISFYYENELELEDWMLDTGRWTKNPFQSSSYDFIDEQLEQEILLEDWMLKPFQPEPVKFKFYILAEKEGYLRLENWMLDKTQWIKRK